MAMRSLAWPDRLFSFDMGAEKRVWRTTVTCFVQRIVRFWRLLIS